jgi:tetratricopeptide (TPR) repeat protein
LRLDIRRVDLASGVTRASYTVEGADLFALVEQLSAELARALGRAAPSASLASVTTTSLAARRLVDEGRRAYYANDVETALQLFDAALRDDSTFAMAAFWASRMASAIAGARQYTLLAQALRWSSRATERERLFIEVQWALASNSVRAVPLADSLVRRFPADVEARLTLGEALVSAGDWPRAIVELGAVVARDTVVLAKAGGHDDAPCTVCVALNLLGHSYVAIDSAEAAERVLRAWTRLRPRTSHAWQVLAVTLATFGRAREAEEAWRRWQALSPQPVPDTRLSRVQIVLRAGDFATADELLAELARDGGAWEGEALWWQAVSYRMQGRLDDALRVILRYHVDVDRAGGTMPFGQVLLERGRTREAARVFERYAEEASASARQRVPVGAPDSMPGLFARPRVWALVQAAGALAAAGDTTRLAALADSLQWLGSHEAFGRDRLLHHHVRGLLLAARGDVDGAVAEYRRAMVSPTVGYTRTNLLLGRLLLAAGRPREAVAALAPALRGDLQASNYYVTRTELHEALAAAWDAAGVADSARVHWEWVARAWSAGDAPFRARAEAARRRLESRR